MKKLIFLSFIILSFMACNQDTKETDQVVEQEVVVTTKPVEIADVPWMAVVDSTSQNIKMVPSDLVKTEDLNPDNVIGSLSSKYPESKIVFQKQQNDTVFISIPNATYLTQSNGSMGAKIFMAEVVYSLTQIQGIKFVNFSFIEGDHASPGTFLRVDFPFSKLKL
jgi:PBP1b-binding outer membrane lipoprotein LpoB